MINITSDYIKSKVKAQGVIPPLTSVLEKGTHLLGKIIDEVTDGDYTHVEIITTHEFWGNKLIHHTMGAQSNGVIPNMLSYLWKQGDPIDFDLYAYQVPLNNDEISLGLEYLENMSFVKYGYLDLLSFPIRKVWPWLADRMATTNTVICSQLKALTDIKIGRQLASFNSKACSPVSYSKLPYLKKITVEI
jgi:hypothetical protein